MKNKKLFLVAFILVAVIIVGFFVFNRLKQPSHFAVVNGWLFEINTDQGLKKFMIRFGSFPNNSGKIVTESELVSLTKTEKWVPPFEQHTKEDWARNCFYTNFEDCDYGYAENLMLNYLQENGINGDIVNAYVGYFMIANSGLNFSE